MSAIVAIVGALVVGLSFDLTVWQIVGLMLLAYGLAPYDK